MTQAADRDTPDLEALFDSIVESNSQPAPAPAPARKKGAAKRAAVDPAEVAPAVAILTAADAALKEVEPGARAGAHALIDRIGHLTRSLHDSLRELGYDKTIEQAAAAIPDAHDRLSYVANLTGQAAEKVLGLTEQALPVQEALGTQARTLSSRWQALFDNRLSVAEFEALVGQTRSYLEHVPTQTAETGRCLRDIMVAQDFHDLTGQVLRKITDMAQRMEAELVKLLMDSVRPETRAEVAADNGLMNGPVINASGRVDVVTDQAQVDDLLASLGF